MLKKLIIGILINLFALLNMSAQNFIHNYDKAQAQATEESKTVLLLFSGSDWCKPCIKLKKTILATDEFVRFANEELVLLEADFPYKRKNKLSKEQTQHNEQLAEKYNQNGAFPKMVLLDGDGKVLEEMTYDERQSTQDYISYIKNNITK